MIDIATLRTLAAEANRAPSVHNTQPARFALDETGHILVLAALSRHLPVGDPTGGYQPSTPTLSGSPLPGQQVIFRQGMSPDQAYPAPAPLAEYPVCTRGQTDKCRNPGGR